MRDKNPYPFDPDWWLSDINVRSCNLLIRSIFVDLMCLMFTSGKYGYLIIEGKQLTFKDVSDYTNVAEKQLKSVMLALLEKKLLVWDDKKKVYSCPLMIERKKKLERNRYEGSKGGHPLLIGKINENEVTDIYVTKRKKKLRGVQLRAFNIFWEEFNYRRGKAEAADAWLDLNVDKELYELIIKGAKRERSERIMLLERGGTPKMAQGWLNGKRWEDHV